MISNIEPLAGKAKKKLVPAAQDVIEKDSDDYKNLVNLLSVLSAATNRLTELETQANESLLEIVDEQKGEYAKLQKTLGDAEAALEVIARRHPVWFSENKTVKTPYGSVALKTNPPKLDVKSDEVSIALIEAAIHQCSKLPDAKRLEGFLRVKKELNLEVLADLTEDELALFKIKRSQSDTFTAKPVKLDLGKAVKSAAEPKGDK